MQRGFGKSGPIRVYNISTEGVDDFMGVDLIFHDSYDDCYRKPFGAVPINERITLRITVNKDLKIKRVIFRLWVDSCGEKRLVMDQVNDDENTRIYAAEFNAPQRPCILWYYFIIEREGLELYYGNNPGNLGGIGKIYNEPPASYQITVYNKNASTPDWFKESIMYQIFVDRFYNGNDNGEVLNVKEGVFLHKDWNDAPEYIREGSSRAIIYDFFGGNLPGIIKKLGYLKELGINIIYLNPVCDSESNHKYDTGDYFNIDPMFGDNNIFKELCKAAEELGIRIILDGVFSHTGSSSIYFNKNGKYNSLGAYQSMESPFYKWYWFKKYPDEYECWWGIDTLPNVNELEDSYLNFIIEGKKSVIKHWMDMGIKGWRLDVADELPDEFIKRFRQRLKKLDNSSVLIGEVWEDASNKMGWGKRREYLFGEELDSVMNYPFRNILIDYIRGSADACHTKQRLMHLYENYPVQHFYSSMNLIGSHDVPRILTLFGDPPDENHMSQQDKNKYKLNETQRSTAVKRLKLAVLIQMTFPGVPCIYYGDEAGLEGMGDPLNRRTYPWGKEDMDILNWYKKLIWIRNYNDVLKTGGWVTLYAEGDVFVYLRYIRGGRNVFNKKCMDNTALIAVNRSINERHHISLDMHKWGIDSMLDVFENNKKIYFDNGKMEVCLNPLEGKLYLENI